MKPKQGDLEHYESMVAELAALKESSKLKNQYIKLLEDECARVATYLHVHRMSCSQEVTEAGASLRDQIATAEKINP